MNHPASVVERGREGGVTSGVIRRDRILERLIRLPFDDAVIEAYKQGYQAGYHAAQKRATRA